MAIYVKNSYYNSPKSLVEGKEPIRTFRYDSDTFVYREAFYNGNLVTLRHMVNGAELDQISDRAFLEGFHADKSHFNSFEIEIDGMRLHDHFEYVSEAKVIDEKGHESLILTLSYPDKNALINVITTTDETGFITRYLEIENKGQESFFISGLYPMAGVLYQEHYANGIRDESLRPNYEIGSYKDNYYLGEGEFEFQKMPKATLKFSHEHPMFNPPVFILRDDFDCTYSYISLETSMMTDAEFTKCGEYFWGRNVNNQDYLHFKVGVDKRAIYREVMPNQKVVSPKVHLGQSLGDLDTIVNKYYHHLRESVIPYRQERNLNPVTYCCSPHDCCQTDIDYMYKEVDKALAVGAEVYLMDAGWFGHSNKWWYMVRGDWFENENLQNRLKEVFDYARSKGLMIGLWAEIEAINFDSDLYKAHPDWAINAYNKLLPNLNALIKEARDYIYDNLKHLIEYYQLDIFRIDGGLKEPSEEYKNGKILGTSWEYYEIVYDTFKQLRKEFPNVYFENCSGGCGRCDLQIMSVFDWESLTDLFETSAHLKTEYGLSLAFSPEMRHNTANYMDITKGDGLFATRMSLFSHITLTPIAESIDFANPILLNQIKHTIDLYKKEIRPLFFNSNMYHHTEFEPYICKNKWIVMELASLDKKKSVVSLFKLNNESETAYLLNPKGLNISSKYDVYFDNSQNHIIISGYDIVNNGIKVSLNGKMQSELIIIKEVE